MTDTTIVGPSEAVKLCGTETTDPPRRRLAAGRLTAELENGQLRYVSFGGIETLRGIAFLVLDENWGTYAPQINELEVEEGAQSFVVSYRAVCADPRQRLVYEARISGSSNGSLTFEAAATPETDFITNRAGFVVLHPAGLAGQRLKVSHVDGREFGRSIPSRDQPVPARLRHPSAFARSRFRALGDLSHGGRRVRNGGSAELDRRVVQDLCAAVGAALGLHARQRQPA